MFIAKFQPQLFFYWSPNFGSRPHYEPRRLSEIPRKKTPEELEIEKIDREIERLNELKRLMKEEKETERKIKEALNSIEHLKNQLERVRNKIADLSKDHPD